MGYWKLDTACRKPTSEMGTERKPYEFLSAGHFRTEMCGSLLPTLYLNLIEQVHHQRSPRAATKFRQT
jgi:hypothetical protein